MAELVLIGLNHFDRSGAERLAHALEIERPDYITLETSAAVLDFLRPKEGRKKKERKSEYDLFADKIRKKMRRLPLQERIESLTFLSKVQFYEPRIALEYHRRVGIPVEPIEETEIQNIIVNNLRIVEQIYDGSQSFLSMLEGMGQRMETQEEIMVNYRRHSGMLTRGDIMEQTQYLDMQRFMDGAREVGPARRLRELMGVDLGKVVHLCGTNHLFLDEKRRTVATLIDDLNPRKMVLHQYGI